MKRFFDNLLIDLVAAVLMLGMVATGYILRFPLPPGTNKSATLWNLTRHQWGDVHFWISLALIGVVVLHVCLHWQWIVISLKRRFWSGKTSPGSSVVVSLTTLLALAGALGLFCWAAQQSVEKITEPRDGVCPAPNSDAGNPPANDGPTITRAPALDGHPKVAFWNDVYPVLERACLSCHGPKQQRADFRVDRREDFFGKDGNPPLIVLERSDESPLIAIVSGKRKDLPRQDRHQLPEEQIAVLRAWIDEGASWPERTDQK